MDDANPAMSP